MKIKHAKVRSLDYMGVKSRTQLRPIRNLVSGIADALESVTLKVKPCDVEGADELNPQSCVVAKALSRSFSPEAVSVCRTVAFIVKNGVAIRFMLRDKNRELIDDFDKHGIFPHRTITLSAPGGGDRLGEPHRRRPGTGSRPQRRPKAIKIDVRALSGGLTHS